jgi:hypothetical protein
MLLLATKDVGRIAERNICFLWFKSFFSGFGTKNGVQSGAGLFEPDETHYN